MLLLALVAIVSTPNNVRTISIFIVILPSYTSSDMMQIFDDDYVTLIPLSRSFEYIFPYWILAMHPLQLTEYCSPSLDPASHLHILCK